MIDTAHVQLFSPHCKNRNHPNSDLFRKAPHTEQGPQCAWQMSERRCLPEQTNPLLLNKTRDR